MDEKFTISDSYQDDNIIGFNGAIGEIRRLEKENLLLKEQIKLFIEIIEKCGLDIKHEEYKEYEGYKEYKEYEKYKNEEKKVISS